MILATENHPFSGMDARSRAVRRRLERGGRLRGATDGARHGRGRAERGPADVLAQMRTELVLWRSRASAARLRAGHPPHYDRWMCIPSHEAAWTSHDTGHNGHYGGLQMSFAERAWHVRGYDPSPTTARMCGLLH